MTDDSRTRPAQVERFAPAKLNLTLAVIRRTASGYHDLHSVMVPLGLGDRLTAVVQPAAPSARRRSRGVSSPVAAFRPSGSPDSLQVAGFDPGPHDDNLVLRAVAATRAAVVGTWPGAPHEPPGLAIRLHKRIPVAAGLAGGSSDAASAIDVALEAWDTRLEAGAAHEIAAGLGSDVPFFLAGGAALITGRGEHVTPLAGFRGPPPGVLLVTPAIAMSTAAVFGTLAAGIRPYVGGASRLTSEHLATELSRPMAPAQLLDRAGVLAQANDLLPAAVAIAPSLLIFRRALARLLRRPVGLSGSGPTLWVLYLAAAEAARAARLVSAAIADGRLPAIGSAAPFVVATTIAAPADRASGEPGVDASAAEPASAPAGVAPAGAPTDAAPDAPRDPTPLDAEPIRPPAVRAVADVAAGSAGESALPRPRRQRPRRRGTE